MRCPTCAKTIKDGTAICPHCDAILDTSFLGPLPEHAAEDTPPPGFGASKAATAPARGASAGARRPAPARRGPAAPRPAREPAREPARARSAPHDTAESPQAEVPRADGDGFPVPRPTNAPGDDESTLVNQDPSRRSTAEVRIADSPATTGEAEFYQSVASESFDQLRLLWRGFLKWHLEDQMTAVAAVALVFLSLFPWSSGEDREEIGLLGWGIVNVFCAGAAIYSVVARRTGAGRLLPHEQMPLVAVGAGALGAISAFLYVVAFGYERVVRLGKAVLVATPAAGAYLSLVAAGVLIIGAVLTYRREKH